MPAAWRGGAPRGRSGSSGCPPLPRASCGTGWPRWRVVWVEKFRLDETAGGASTASSWMLDFLRLARLPRRAKLFRRRTYLTARRATRPFERPWRAATPVILRGPRLALENPITRKVAALLFGAAVAAVALAGLWQLWLLLAQLG